MAEKRSNQSAMHRRETERYYIDGNTARRLNEQPQIPKRTKKNIQEQPKQAPGQTQEKSICF